MLVINNPVIHLSPDDLPKKYYNIMPDIMALGLDDKPLPPLHPGTKEPVGPEDLAPLFPMELIKQEVSTEPYIDIPDEVLEVYQRHRPSPLYRARRLEEVLKTNAEIYFKFEGNNPTGSHKFNTAVAQAYYNAKQGTEKIFTETGAGQWGSALAYACALFDIDLEVFMVRASFDQKPFRKTLMQMYGAKVNPSPSNITDFGKKLLKENPDHTGSLGTAITEAIEQTVKSGGTAKYSLGSVLGHVLTHQSIIGLETEKQLESIEKSPDIAIGCLGGGSNFAGFSYPLLRHKIQGKKPDLEVIAVESTAAPKMTHGKFQYDFGDTGKMTPLLPMYTIGNEYIPAPIHAGGLRYHGASPSVSYLLKNNLISAEAYNQVEVFESASLFTKAEGILPAPESAHAIHSAIVHARKYKNSNDSSPVIVFNLSGHGLLDLTGYNEFLQNNLKSYNINHEMIKKNLESLPST